MKGEEEKFRQLNSGALLAYSGEAGDTVNFCRIHSKKRPTLRGEE